MQRLALTLTLTLTLAEGGSEVRRLALTLTLTLAEGGSEVRRAMLDGLHPYPSPLTPTSYPYP